MKVLITVLATLIVLPGCRTISEAQINSSVDRIVKAIKGEIGEYYGNTKPVNEPVTEPVEDPPTSAEIISRLDTLIDTSNTVMDASAFVSWSPRAQTTPSTLSFSDLNQPAVGTAQYESVQSRYGVLLARGSQSSRVGDAEFLYAGYAGWMDHSFFLAIARTTVSHAPLDPRRVLFPHSYSVGNATGTNPVSGGAVWQGAMAGIDRTQGNAVLGDATVRVDFADALAAVEFTNIEGGRSDISWSGLSLSGGSFEGSGIVGRFYGPAHDEVGGLFLRGNLTGGFGAKR